MKKIYLVISLLLAHLYVLAGNRSKLSEDTWTVLIILGIILIVVLAYLFLHASFEQVIHDKKIKEIHEENPSPEEENKQPQGNTTIYKKRSDDLLNLFMLKRNGIINDREYQQLKDRLLRKSS